MANNTQTKPPVYFTIQEVTQKSGLSEHTLRYYERIGLLNKVDRDNSSRHRRYTEEDVRMIEALACLRTTGMSIDDMRKFLTLIEDGEAVADQQLALFEMHRQNLEQEIAQKQKHLRYLEQKVAFWKAIQNGDEPKAREIGEITAGMAKQILMDQ